MSTDNGPIASQTKKLRDLKKKLQHFWAKPKRMRDRDMFVYYVFIFIFVNVMLILKEFCISKGSHSKILVNQPSLIMVHNYVEIFHLCV